MQFIFVGPWQLDHSRNICTIATEIYIWYDVFIIEKESAPFHNQLVLINFTHPTMFDIDRNLIISLQQKNEIMQYHMIFDQHVCNHASYTLLNFINEHHHVTCTDLYSIIISYSKVHCGMKILKQSNFTESKSRTLPIWCYIATLRPW